MTNRRLAHILSIAAVALIGVTLANTPSPADSPASTAPSSSPQQLLEDLQLHLILAQGDAAALAAQSPATAPALPLAITCAESMAPAAVQVQLASVIAATTLPSTTIDQIPYVKWDFGDPGGRHNQSVGFNAAHLYEQPGVYTITGTLIAETGAAGSITRSSTIYQSAINIAADSRPSVCVANSGDDRNPGTQAAPLATLGAAMSRLGPHAELLLHAGDTFPVSGTINLALGDHIDTYGGAAPATIQYSGSAGGFVAVKTSADNVIRNTGFTGAPFGVAAFGHDITIDKCSASGASDGYFVQADTQFDGLFVQDCSTSGIQGYSVFLGGSDAVLCGNQFASSLTEHLIRGAASRVAVIGNTLANLQSNTPQTSKSIIAPQDGAWWWIAQNTGGPGGPVSVGPISTSQAFVNSPAASVQWSVVEANTLASPVKIEPGSAHVIVRNNSIRQDNAASIILDTPASGVDSTGHQVQRNIADAQVLFNTLNNQGTNGYAIQAFASFGGPARVIGNFYNEPNVQIGNYFAAPMKVFDANLAAFMIGENTWGNPASVDYHLPPGSLNYVGSEGQWTCYMTAKVWNSAIAAGNGPGPDTQANVPATLATPAGVFTDQSGAARPATSHAGAAN
jgi:PKD repeat protein